MWYLHIQVPVTPEGDNKGSADWEIENKCDGVFRGQELIRWTIQELIDRNAKPTIVIGGKKPNQTQNLKTITRKKCHPLATSTITIIKTAKFYSTHPSSIGFFQIS